MARRRVVAGSAAAGVAGGPGGGGAGAGPSPPAPVRTMRMGAAAAAASAGVAAAPATAARAVRARRRESRKPNRAARAAARRSAGVKDARKEDGGRATPGRAPRPGTAAGRSKKDTTLRRALPPLAGATRHARATRPRLIAAPMTRDTERRSGAATAASGGSVDARNRRTLPRTIHPSRPTAPARRARRSACRGPRQSSEEAGGGSAAAPRPDGPASPRAGVVMTARFGRGRGDGGEGAPPPSPSSDPSASQAAPATRASRSASSAGSRSGRGTGAA